MGFENANIEPKNSVFPEKTNPINLMFNYLPFLAKGRTPTNSPKIKSCYATLNVGK